MVKQLETLAEFDEAIASEKLTVVDFTATWCGPCQRIAPKFEAMAADCPEVQFVKVDVDANAETAQACGVQCMPTFQFYKAGQKIDEMSGANEEGLRQKIEANK